MISINSPSAYSCRASVSPSDFVGPFSVGFSCGAFAARSSATRTAVSARCKCATLKYGSVLPPMCYAPILLANSSQLRPFCKCHAAASACVRRL